MKSISATWMSKRSALVPFLIATAWCAFPALAVEPKTLADYMALRGPPPTARIAYGPSPFQYVEFFKPAGAGPFPVAVLVHGGCFFNAYQGVPQMRGMAAALAAQGVAVWNVEFRGVDTLGGGYPGTFQDMASAIDLLAVEAGPRRLDTKRLVMVGHSAGAALALWAASRANLPPSSVLRKNRPLPIANVAALGGIVDLRSLSEGSARPCDLDAAELVGQRSAIRPDPFADTNPVNLAPKTARIIFINGDHDTVVPPDRSARDAARMRTHGLAAEALVLPNSSHYDEVAVTSPAWKLVEPTILKILGAR